MHEKENTVDTTSISPKLERIQLPQFDKFIIEEEEGSGLREKMMEKSLRLNGSLACLKTRGYMVSFGQSSGAPDPVPLSAIAVKSLFLTRPSLSNYAETRDELLGMAGEVFGNVQSGVLRVRVNHTYPLSQAAQAHEDLENRKTSGSVVLIP
ncbi:uncharacterized protein LOC110746498 [Prunus avium]|uniref:Uncharacterized protein LOC110746498 n=1 Tax=Prunus avium TaxID=42229 RepID=A0A6P5RBU9_PRUAV|nr:uncharacterized protein LOC110746498 [Prunus avium]